MKLTFDQIKSACTGAVSITEEDGLIRFHRMHPAQLDAALARSEAYHIRAHSTTGVKLTFRTNYRTMLENIQANYPGVPVFALTPVFRYALNECREMGAFCKVGPIIQEICAGFPDVTVIDCFPFIPRDPLCFGDGILHPNAKGFDYYFNGLWKQMHTALKE